MSFGTSETLDILLSHVLLDRNSPQRLHVQIRNAIELAIFSGEIPDGAQLPSVRQLSEALNVAPNTVIRAYHDLRAQEWISASPKRGYFVELGSENGTLPDAVRVDLLERLDGAIRVANEAGLDDRALLQLLAERLRAKATSACLVAVVGFRESHLDERVTAVRDALSDFDVDVIGIPYQAREEQPGLDELLSRVQVFFAPVGEAAQSRELLGDHFSRIVPMTRKLVPDVEQFILSQPPSTCFGAITSLQDNVGRLVGILKQVHPLNVSPLTAATENPDEVEAVIERAEVILIGSRARPYFERRPPLDKPSAVIERVPDEKSLARLRARVNDITRTSSTDAVVLT